MQSQNASPLSMPALLVMTGLAAWAVAKVGPLMVAGEFQLVSCAAYGFAALCGLRVASELLTRLAGLTDWLGARRASGRSGTARWAGKKDLKPELTDQHTGPFWGLLSGTKIPQFIDIVSNAMCVAPAGSGKGIFVVIVNILSIRASKVVADFKGELVCVLKEALKKRGEFVRILNPGNLWGEIIGRGDTYNPHDIIVDDLYRPGGLRDVPDDLREQGNQIYPEPSEHGGENKYFREGSRLIIWMVSLIECMLCGYDATLSSVALMIEDRRALEYHLRWVLGIDLEGQPLPEGPMPIAECEWAQNHDSQDLEEFIQLVRARASGLLALLCSSDNRTFDSFHSGAQQALAPFAFGRLAPAMRRSSFSMDELKDRTTTLFIVSDASRPEAYKPYIGLIQWCAMTALKRHPKKDVPVYLILDEATNYVIHGLSSLLTWGRSYGLRLLLVFQDLSAFENTYGDKTLETLLSETEVKYFLPGQRSPKTLTLIEKMLGEQSVMGTQTSQSGLEARAQDSVSESARKMMSDDEIRRTRHAILIVRQQPPALIEPVSYAEISPFRDQAGINPFHGTPFMKPVKLTLLEPKS